MTGSGTQNQICHWKCYCHLVLEPFKRLEEYETMRLEGHFFDIGHGIKAHQVVMGSLSEALVPALPSIYEPILERLIEFAYNGHFYVGRTYIEAILGIACQYDINPLKKFIADHLITNLTLDNAIDTFNLALNNLCHQYQTSQSRMIRVNSHHNLDLSHTFKFQKLNKFITFIISFL